MIDLRVYERIKAASLESDCFPEPPTPTSRACPPSPDTILVILQT